MSVSGHPGSTQRLQTVAELLRLRDVTLPTWLLRSAELRGRLIQFGKTSPEAYRRIQDLLLGLENSIKVRRKLLDALHEDSLLAVKRSAERELASRVDAEPALRGGIGNPWNQIARAEEEARGLEPHLTWIERDLGFTSRLYSYAKTLVRGTAERAKPNDRRLREYCAAHTAHEVDIALNDAKIGCSRVYNTRDQYEDEHYAAREMTVPVLDRQSGVPIRVYGVVPKMSLTPGRIWRGAPSIGDDTTEILANMLGLSDAAIEALYADQTVHRTEPFTAPQVDAVNP